MKMCVSPKTVDGGQQQFIMTQTAEDQRGVQTQILDQHLHPVTAEQLLDTSSAGQSSREDGGAVRQQGTCLTFLCTSPSQSTDSRNRQSVWISRATASSSCGLPRNQRSTPGHRAAVSQSVLQEALEDTEGDSPKSCPMAP